VYLKQCLLWRRCRADSVDRELLRDQVAGGQHADTTHHAPAVTETAKTLRIELLYLPTYSSNLNLIERFWKFLKHKVARNRYHATFVDFRAAVQQALNNLSTYRDELASLLIERFPSFTMP
jgi:transposase